MAVRHFNEPRDLAYSKQHSGLFQGKDSWLDKNSRGIFAGRTQRDLFIFAMALGKYRKQKSDLKDRQANIPVQTMAERQKWAVLSISLAGNNDLMCLKDENTLYKEAERYAEEGLKILQSHADKWGSEYPKFLEAELKEILQKSESGIE